MSSFFNYHIKGRVKIALERARLNRSDLEPLLVFTMAKVGSSSVYNSTKHSTDLPAFHIHSLDEEEVTRTNQRCFDEGLYPDSYSPVPFLNSDIIRKNRPFKVISLFRNPVERNLSAFFDAFRLMTGTSAHTYDGDLEHLVDVFYEKVNHDYPLLWYQQHFGAALGINVYEHAFDKKKGYAHLEKDKCSILILNSAVPDETKESLIAEFLDRPMFRLKNANVRGDTKEANLYRDFKAHISLKPDYLHHLTSSEYFNHFFDEAEKQRTFDTWLKA